jgi:hypothetical protein
VTPLLSVRTLRGVVLVLVEPSPTWPKMPQPQHMTLPVASRVQE